MKYALATGFVMAGMVVAGAAMAQGGWSAPTNGKVSAVMTDNNAVMMKISMPPKEFKAMEDMMKNGNKDCHLMEIYPGATDTMILTCGG